MIRLVQAVALAIIVVVVSGFSGLDAHHLGNLVTVRVGGWCSGTIIDKKRGLVSTAFHCLTPARFTQEGAIEGPSYHIIHLTLTSFDDYGKEVGKTEYDAEVVGGDQAGDTALLRKVRGPHFLNEAKISYAPLRFGDHIFTIGNPMGISGMISEGIVSRPNILIDMGNGPTYVVLFDAMMDHGSSGGGLFDSRGRLVGITNFILNGGNGARFSGANPISNIKALLSTLAL